MSLQRRARRRLPGIGSRPRGGRPEGEGAGLRPALCTLLSGCLPAQCSRPRGLADLPCPPFSAADSPVPPLRASSALPPQPGCGSVHGPIAPLLAAARVTARAGNLAGSGAGWTHSRLHMLPAPTVCPALSTDGLSGISRPLTLTPSEIVMQRHRNIPARCRR